MENVTWLVATYMMVSAVLGGLLQALSPNSTWLPWSIPGPVRALAAVLLTAAITGLDQASTGRPLGTTMLVAFVTSSPVWGVLIWQVIAVVLAKKSQAARLMTLSERMAEENRASQLNAISIQANERGVVGKTNPPPPPAAGLLILLGLSGMLNQACTGTLEGTRPRLTSVAGVSLKLASPGSQECLSLSRSESTWSAAALGAGALGASGTAGGIVVLLEQDNDANAAVYVALIAGGMLDAAAIFAKQIADGYNRDWVALGCGTPAA
jgi:hypothetical protein